ncbi:MAG: LytTR family DNA-binding domain-containing protein [Flavobacteriales bacterium]|nr:LytTR family DNA-binding domain-containing protein [Flavobacteriales bacterium]
MMNIKTLIVDDEPQARVALNGILSEPEFEDVTVVGEARDIPEAVKQINQLQPDLVLLDIEMPGYNGLELLRFFDPADITFKIVFVTAYSEYAIHAFELSAVDYLLKPVQPVQLRKAIDKIKSSGFSQKQGLEVLNENTRNPEHVKIALQVAEGLLITPLSEIMYLKADGSYTQIFFTDGRRIVVSRKLIEYEKLEKYAQFIRVHRSHMVNMTCVKKYLKQDNGILVMPDNEHLSVSADKKSTVLDWWKEIKI